MLDKLYIDGVDPYREWGVFLVKGAYGALVGLPGMKALQSIEWAERDGSQVDLTEPVAEPRELSIAFAGHRAQRVGAFFDLLSDGVYHVFDFVDLGRSFKLRLVSQGALEVGRGLQTFTLRFADDFPLPHGYEYLPPQSSLVWQDGYEIDGRPLSQYGVYVLQGSDSEILKSPSVKTNLLQNISSQHGTIYQGQLVKFQTKEVRLSCLMRASSIEEFWRNHDALLFDLVRPGERSLYVDNTGYEYPCYYKSCSVSEFYPRGKIWFKFDLTLVFTSFRVEDDQYLLASEAGQWIMTQEGELAIDLRELIN